MALTFSYGEYSFSPKPLFTIGKEYIKTPSQMGLGTRYTVTLEGQIIPQTGKIPGGDPQAGLQEVFSGVQDLRSAFDSDFKCLSLVCDGAAPIISGYPRIVGFEVSNASDNYVIRSDYSITLELPSLTGAGFDPVGPVSSGSTAASGVDALDFSASGIISYTDEFTVELMDERMAGGQTAGSTRQSVVDFYMPTIYSVQRNITAQGDSLASPDYIHPWERAQSFVDARLGYPLELEEMSGILCSTTKFNNYRTKNVNKTEGTVTVNETYLAMTGGQMPFYEELSVNVGESLEDPFMNITVDGTVHGLISIEHTGGCMATGVSKFNNALAGFSGISGAAAQRAGAVYHVHVGLPGGAIMAGGAKSGGTAPGGYPPNGKPTALNKYPLTRTFGYNPIAGTVTYSFTFNNRPYNLAANAVTENITFSEVEPPDIFASITILGKANGPLLQHIGTVGPRTRSLSIDSQLPVVINAANSGFYYAPVDYDAFVISYAAELAKFYTQVYVTDSSKTWEPRTGRFTLNQSWTVGNC